MREAAFEPTPVQRPEWREVLCACGGELAAFNTEESIKRAVFNHRRGGRHWSWSVRNYGEPPPEVRFPE